MKLMNTPEELVWGVGVTQHAKTENQHKPYFQYFIGEKGCIM